MIKIAHRGNLSGPSHRENQPSYIAEALAAGYEVEVDLWLVSDRLWLGHDGPQYLITEDFLLEIGHAAWIHCKNLEALNFLTTIYSQLNYFWHQEDDYTLTSQRYIWTYPGKAVTSNAVIVDCDLENLDEYKNNILGVCTDYPTMIG